MTSGPTTMESGRTASPPRVSSPRESVWARRFGDLDRWDAVIAVVLAAAYLYIQLDWMLRNISLLGGDQLDYFSIAGDLQETMITHRHLRIGLTLPVRLMTDLFGYSEVAYYTVPILAGLLFLTATYLLGALLHSRAAGAIGAIVATFNAHVLWDSSHLLPDLLAAGLFTMGIVLIGGARPRETGRWDPALIGAGLLLGWSYLTREFTVIFFPVALMAAYSAARTRLRDLFQIAAGALAMLLVEFVHGTVLFGDPLAHIKRVIGFKGPSLSTAAPSIAGSGEGNSLTEMATVLPNELLHSRGGGWLFVVLAVGFVVGGALAVVLRQRASLLQLLVPLVWVAMVYGVLTVMGWSTNSRGGSVINITKIRYWYPIFPALAIGGVVGILAPLDGGLARLTTARVGRWTRNLVVVALLAVAGLGSYASLDSIDHSTSFVRNGAGAEFREFRDWVASEGQSVDRFYADTGHGRSMWYILPVYLQTAIGRDLWSGEIQDVYVKDPAPAPDEIDGAVVVHRISTARMVVKDQMISWLGDIPDTWAPMLVTDDGLLAVFATDHLGPTQTDLDVGPSTLAEGSGATETADGWEVDLAAGEPLRIVAPVTGASSDETTSSIDLSDDLVGEGWLTVICAFADGSREVAFNVVQETGDPAASEFFCEGPGLNGIELEMEGPLQGTLDAVTARLTTSSS